MGFDESLDLSREILAESEEKKECRLGEYSGRLFNKGSRYKREFVTITFDDMND